MERYKSWLQLLLLVVGILQPCLLAVAKPPHSNHTQLYEEHASKILAAAKERMENIYNRERRAFLDVTTSRGYHVINQVPIKQMLNNDRYELLNNLANDLSSIPISEIKNATLKRQIQRLSKVQLIGLEKEDFEVAKERLRTMQSFLTMRTVCTLSYLDGCTQSIAMIPGIIINSMRTKKLDELEHYWFKWRTNINARNKARTTFTDYVNLFRKAAHYNGHVTPSRTWFLNFETPNFLREMEDVMLEVMPLYQELHAFLRSAVRSHYGDKVMDEDASIPAPIFEQLVHQAWFNNTVFDEPYPGHPLPAIHTRLKQVMVTATKVNTKAAEFFQSLGLNRMEDSFYKNFSRRMMEGETGGDCKSEVYYFPPDVGLRYCPKIDYKKYMQMHGIIAELEYNLYRRNLPLGLDNEPCPGFGAAIGEAAVISSGTPRHLYRAHILINDSLSMESSMNRLFRMAVHTVLAIPQYFVYDKFFADVLDGRIKPEEYNCKYWELQAKYAGVVPPIQRSDQHFDVAYRFYRGLQPDKSNTMKFISEVLGLNFYRAFCLASGSYRPSETDRPLHNCDFYGSTKAGDMIRKMMELGATRHWRDVMQIATGDRKLNAKGVMEYFAPLFEWLHNHNKENNVAVGWDEDSRCSNE